MSVLCRLTCTTTCSAALYNTRTRSVLQCMISRRRAKLSRTCASQILIQRHQPATLEAPETTQVVPMVRPPSHRYPQSIAYPCLPVEDGTEKSLHGPLDHTADGQHVPQCEWRRFRSVSEVAASLIGMFHLSFDDTLRLLHSRSVWHAQTPDSFAQLRVYERVTRLREIHASVQAAIADRERSSRSIG